ncbi:MAG: M99 family carboxypeptidase catalytic domain-containing protein [Sulfurimonas sp.]|jgi:hypothetical protein|nr:M99 family carboxypeptidase catalytic domain-containing protein [Sulfurimonadaceae bacterium]
MGIKNLYILLVFLLHPLYSSDIQLIKKGENGQNGTLLVIGGIHGDEDGAYFAASILATNYDIKSKSVWIVPNLNKDSITKGSRGINGDMNRKFAFIEPNDKDEEIVSGIKDIILDKQVSLVLNLHDGHGFYRKTNDDILYNPRAWGQSCVIDQCKLPEDHEFGDMGDIAEFVTNQVNQKLLQKHHSFNVKNTKTKINDKDMQQSLTFFAATHNKPAFAIESSKNLSKLSQKVYYHLLAVEEFMGIMNISYTKNFELNEDEITKIIKNYGNLSINDNFVIDLTNIKKTLSYVPIKLNGNEFKFTHPLGSVLKNGVGYDIYIGNIRVLYIRPQYFKLKEICDNHFEAEVDGEIKKFDINSDIYVNESFKIIKRGDYRVNLIGFVSPDSVDESDILVRYEDFEKRFSIDRDDRIYRVEFYKNDDFCSMAKVHFNLGIKEDEKKGTKLLY